MSVEQGSKNPRDRSQRPGGVETAVIATTSRHPTTVALPAISADELAGLVQQMIVGEPTAAARIQRGAGVLLAGALADTDTLGVYRVLGCDGRIYRTSSGSCTCPDATNRGVTCKHQWSARLLSAASACARYNRWTQTHYTLTTQGYAATQRVGS